MIIRLPDAAKSMDKLCRYKALIRKASLTAFVATLCGAGHASLAMAGDFQVAKAVVVGEQLVSMSAAIGSSGGGLLLAGSQGSTQTWIAKIPMG